MIFAKEEPKFTYDWVSDMTDTWSTHLEPYKALPNLRYLEIGVFEGRSMIWMLENILTHKSSHATGIDFFYFATEKEVYHNLRCRKVDERCDLINGRSEQVLRKMTDEQFDLIFVDADHRSRGAYTDLALSWDLLKVGGTLIFDDYSLFSGTHPHEARPQLAIDAFLSCFQNEFDLVFKNLRQVAVRKKNVWSGNLVTEFGPYSLDWGIDENSRVLRLIKTGEEVELFAEELDALVKLFIDRSIGELKPKTNLVEPSLLSQLEKKLKYEF